MCSREEVGMSRLTVGDVHPRALLDGDTFIDDDDDDLLVSALPPPPIPIDDGGYVGEPSDSKPERSRHPRKRVTFLNHSDRVISVEKNPFPGLHCWWLNDADERQGTDDLPNRVVIDSVAQHHPPRLEVRLNPRTGRKSIVSWSAAESPWISWTQVPPIPGAEEGKKSAGTLNERRSRVTVVNPSDFDISAASFISLPPSTATPVVFPVAQKKT